MASEKRIKVYQGADFSEVLALTVPVAAGDTFSFYMYDYYKIRQTFGSVLAVETETEVTIQLDNSVTNNDLYAINVQTPDTDNPFYGNWFLDRHAASGKITREWLGVVCLSVNQPYIGRGG